LLLGNSNTALKGNDWIADYLFKRQEQIGIKRPLYTLATIYKKVQRIAAKVRAARKN
jgi:hypothetical protein